MAAGALTKDSALTTREASNNDRLTATLCLALVLHALLIFGVGFAPKDVAEPRYDALEVILVTRSEPNAPEDTDLAAQANLDGGGETETTERPATPTDAPFPAPQPTPAQPAVTAAPPTPPTPPASTQPPLPPTPTPQTEAETPPTPPTKTGVADAAPPKRLLAKDTERAKAAALPKPERDAPVPQTGKTERSNETKTELGSAPAEPPPPSAAQLIASSMEMASLNAELEQRLEAMAKRPRRKYISARTKEYKYAAYLEAWRSKVERVGNLNYPDSARRANLSGSLLLDVALNPDGSVSEITVRRSSGHQLLDEAAINIVRLAAPYAPFPPDIRKEVDVLHITRTWQFLNSDRFSAN